MISAWSYSRLATFEQCPFRAKLAYVDKIPEPERPLPPGKTEHANDRGSRIHEAAERFVRGETELIPELATFAPELTELRENYKRGCVSLEGEWGFDREWTPVAWMAPEVWARIKLDAMVTLNDEVAVVIDYKTGKKSGNEVKHSDQGRLYAVGTILKCPTVQMITTEFWYTDQDDITSTTYTRNEVLQMQERFTSRALRMTSATEFPARPNKFNCKWCPYSPKGTGHCAVGVV